MNPYGNPNQVPTNLNTIAGSSSVGNNYPWNVVNANAQANRYLNDMLSGVMGNALLDSMRPQNLYGLQPNVLNPRPLQFQPFSGNPLIGGDTNPFLLNGVLNSMLPALWEIPQNVNNNPLWATGLQNSPAADAFLNRPGGTAFGNIPLPNSSQQDNGVLQNPATLPTFPDNRGIQPFLERHSEEFPLTNTVVQTLPATALVHPSDGGNNGGISIPKTSGDFLAESSIGRNGHDIAQNQPGPSAMSTTATQTEPFDHFNPLLPVVPTNGNSHDRGEVYVNHPDGGRATAVVDVEGLPVEQVQRLPQQQLTYTENAGSEDTTGTVLLQNSYLNNNPTTVPYVVGHAEKGAAEIDILPEVAERENGGGGSDINGQVATTAPESEKAVSSSETATLFCGLEGCSQCFVDSEKLCRHLQLAHSLPTYVVTIDFATKMEYSGFRKEYLSNEDFHKMDVDGNYTVYTCQRLLPGEGNTTALRLVEATRGKVSSLYDQDYKGPVKLQPRCGPFVRQGGLCPAFVMVERDGARYNVKICDWHLHGSVIPTRTLEMTATMLLLKNIPLPAVRMIIQGQTTEFCTPLNSLDLYMRRLDLKQFECLCEFARKRYAGHIDMLRRKMGYLELTRFERSCITEYSTQQRALKAKYSSKVDLTSGSSHMNSHHLTEEGALLDNVQTTYENRNKQSGKKRECRSFSSLHNESKRCNTK